MKVFWENKKRCKLILGGILIATALALSFLWFSNSLSSIITGTNSSFLEETASHQAALFNTKLTDQLDVLESLAKQFSNVNFQNYNELKEAVLSLNGIGDFKQLTVADSSGACMSNNNTYSANISKKQYFRSALAGEPTVSNGIEVDAQGDDILALSVPIHQKNKVVGVLTGTYDRSVLDSLFTTTSFNGLGYTYVIDSEGNVMVKSANSNSQTTSTNYFDYLKGVSLLSDKGYDEIRNDFASGSAGTIRYTAGSQERFASYYPVGLHNWYVLTVITDEVNRSQNKDFAFIITIFIIVLAAILLAVFIYILGNIQKTELLMRKNERFAMVNVQNQSVIFDYDISKKILELSGDINFLLGNYPANAPVDVKYIASRIHSDDLPAFEKFVATYKDSNVYNAFEARFLCEDNAYYWFRLSSTLIKDKDKPYKLVGNIINVESQTAQDVALTADSETDRLTGLLQKDALQRQAEAFLKTQSDHSVHALYLIDLDNFKSINDNLGHIYGDKVLSDTAGKLSRIFSEEDFIGRTGGNTFAVFLNLSSFDNVDNARRIIDQKGHSLKHSLHESYNGQNNLEVTLTASIGISIYGQDANSYATLYDNADKALYTTKKNGKNAYTYYSSINN